MFDFLIEARDLGLYRAITDNGAGGLSSSIGEMAETPGGARVDLANAPLKYAGLAPWEIFLSEAQERMTLAVAPSRIDAFLDLARRREVEACDLGTFTDDGILHITHGDEPVAFLDMEFLHDGDPDLDLTARWTAPRFEEPTVAPPDDLGAALVDVVGRLNPCSNERKARHYDHEVKGLTVVKPWVGVHQDVPAEATVLLAHHESFQGYVLSEGVHPFLSDLDTEAMARVSLDEAVRRQLCAGARIDRIAALDNFCWPDPVRSDRTPDGEYKLAQLVRACRGLHDLCLSYGTPLISGKDSMKNDSVMGGVKISVPPTLLVSAIGVIDDVRDAVTLDLKSPGDVLFVLGTTADEAGGSEWYRYLADRAGRAVEPGRPAPFVGTRPPRVDADRTVPLYRALHGAVRAGLVRSAVTPGRGGLAVAIARSAMAGALGVDADLANCDGVSDLRSDIALFGESAGRFVVGVAASDADAFEGRFEGLPCRRVGAVTDDGRVRLRRADATLVACDVERLRAAFRETLEHA
jgi:phosphoribosylformylglycinamidine synthase